MLPARSRLRRRRFASSLESLEPRCLLATLTLTPVADAFVRGGSYAATNYGSGTSLAVSNQSTDANDRESFLRFDLSAVNGPIRKATLTFVPGSLGSAVPSATYRIGLLNDAADGWVEGNGGTDNRPANEITWNNRPTALAASATFSGSLLKAGQTASIDVTALVNASGNTNKLVSLRLDAPASAANQQLTLGSREAAAASRPTLVVDDDAPVAAAWPDRVFAPYVDATNWPPFDFVSMARTEGVKYFTLAFIVADASNQPSWGGYYSMADRFRVDDIAALRALGGDAMISFGGAAGTELAVAIKDVTALTNAYQTVIDTYNLTHIDFDIEGAWVADKASIDRRSQAIRNLQAAAAAAGRPLNVWFTLPVLPQGLTQDGLYVVQSALANGVKIGGVNVMAMDYGDSAAPAPDGKMGQYAIDAANSLSSQLKTAYSQAGQSLSDAELWAKVGVTPMIGQNDVATERFYQSDAQKLLAFAMSKPLGYLAFWSANRDNGSVPAGQLSGNGSGVSQTPFEFSHILNPFTGNNVPTFSVDDVKVAEGDSGSKSLVFTVTLSKPLAQTTTVNYASADGSAKAGSDYTSTSGTVSFAPGETAKTVSVSILGDLTSEGDETFSLVLSSAVGAAIAKSNGVGTIVDDDAPPSISVNDASLTEGNSGTGNAVFTVTLSRAAKAGETIAVTYKTADATAIAPGDYQSATGTIAFAAGQTAASVTVKIVGDTTAEPSETFTLNLSNPVGATFARNAGIGTIVDDDTPAAQVTYAITSQWDGGFIGQVTIKNTTNKAWTGWTLEWDAAFSLVNIWSVTLSSIVNGHFVIKPADWTRSVAPGASITFGFEARGAAATPSGIRLTPVF